MSFTHQPRLNSSRGSWVALATAMAGILGATHASAQQLPVYVLTNLVAEEQTNTGAPEGRPPDDVAVTPDGSRMVVSTIGDLLAGCTSNTQGAIYIYDYDDQTDTWVLNDAIKNCSYLGFGHSLSISDDGTTILLGCNTAGYQNSGRAWVYREIGGVWTLEFSPSDDNRNYGQGASLDSTGSLAVIVAPGLGGYCTIDRRDGSGVWNQEAYIGPFDAFSDFWLGDGCAIDGNWAAVFAADQAGVSNHLNHLRMYEYTGSGWVFRQRIDVPDDTSLNGAWGDIEIDGDRMIVGQGGCCGNPGYARIYEFNAGTGLWELAFEDVGNAGDNLGYDVDILGDRAIATRYHLNDSVYYERINGVWQSAGRLEVLTLPQNGQCASVMDRGFMVGSYNTESGYGGFLMREYAAPVAVCSFTETFDGLTEIPNSLYAIARPCTLEYIDNDQLVLERPAGCADNHNVVQSWGDVITGDFDISIDLERFGNEPFFIGESAYPLELIARRLDYSEQMNIQMIELAQVFSLYRAVKSYDGVGGPGNFTEVEIGGVTAGSFRIARVGTTWSSYYKLSGDTNWTLLRTATLTDAPVIFDLWQSGYQTTGFGVRLDNLVVTTGASCGGCNEADLAVPFGTLDFFDVLEFLDLFAANDPAADLTGDGVFDFFDAMQFLELFSAGCP